MSRVANSPVEIPKGVETNVSDTESQVRGVQSSHRFCGPLLMACPWSLT